MLTLEFGIAPDYVLDRMQHYEIAAILDFGWRRERSAWEQARFIAQVTAQCQSTKPITAADILQLPWDNKEDEEKDTTATSISEADRQRLIEQMKQYEKIM